MISRRTQEGTQEVSSGLGRRQLKRGIKRKGILPSFGDIVLPIVSVAAVGLLVLAGRQFFINGFKSSPGIKSTKAYTDSPALIAEREQEILPPVVNVANVPEEPEPVENVTMPEESFAIAETATPAKNVTEPAKTATPAKVSTPAKAATPAKTSTAKTTTTAKAPAKAATLPTNKQWRVQVGAYGTKAAAQETATKLKKKGYKAEVYSNPASKHVKVWVYSGGDKAAALRVVEAMKALGYKSSFAFPPAK